MFCANINPYPHGAGVTAPFPQFVNRQKREGKVVRAERDRTALTGKLLHVLPYLGFLT
jgi:hypothetical protein